MPSPAGHEDAKAAYAVQSALVELRLDELRAALGRHERQRTLEQEHVADLVQVELRLAKLIGFLAGTRPA